MSDDNQDSWLGGLGIDVSAIKQSISSAVGFSSDDSSTQNSSSDATSNDDNSSQTAADQNANPQPTPAPASNGAVQSTDPQTIQAEQDAARDQSLQNSEYYQQGYQDGVNGADAKPPPTPLGPDALDGYNMGYTKGHAEWMANTKEEPEDHLPEEGFEHVLIHGLLHDAVHFLHIGGGIYTMLVAMTVGMECDTKMWLFKCPTCGDQGEAQCTEEEAQADADKHKQVYPDHVPEVKGPGSE